MIIDSPYGVHMQCSIVVYLVASYGGSYHHFYVKIELEVNKQCKHLICREQSVSRYVNYQMSIIVFDTDCLCTYLFSFVLFIKESNPLSYMIAFKAPSFFTKSPNLLFCINSVSFMLHIFLQQVIQPTCPSVLQRHFYMEAAVLCFYQWWCSYSSVKLVSSMPTPLSETLQKSEHFGAGPNPSCPVQGDMCQPGRQ